MKDLPPLIGRVLSVFVVWTMMAAVFVAGGLQMSAKAATYCSQSNVIIGGDWTVSGNEVCQGTIYTMTGNLIVPAGTSLELRDGGIRFAQTPANQYSVQVSGNLRLDNSIITVTGETIDPYLKFNFQVLAGGRVDVLDNSRLAFPGWITTTGGEFWMSKSSIGALDYWQVLQWSVNVDEEDDGPVMNFANTGVRVFDSSISDLFEKNGTVDSRRMINVTGSTTFLAINSYIGIDFANSALSADMHNTMSISGVALAYLMWCTVDETQNPSNLALYSNAIVPTGATSAYIYRRGDITVADKYGAPVKDALVFTRYSGTGTVVTYPESGSPTPGVDVLNYLGRTAGNWNVTDASGQVTIPLISDRIDSVSVAFRGNYNVTARYIVGPLRYVTTKQTSVAHWPLASTEDNSISLMLQFSEFSNPLPDLKPIGMLYTPLYPKVGDFVTINVTVGNTGLGPAGRFWVRVYDNIVSPSALMHEEQLSSLGASSTTTLTSIVWNFTTGGTHLIRVVMDPLNQVFESDKTNNDQAFSLHVTPLGPDLEAFVATMVGFAGNPVDLTATINNKGDTNVTGVAVDFYIDSLSALIGTVSDMPVIPVGGSVNATFAWVPPGLGTYTVFAWVDPDNVIPEPAPYSETNNIGSATLTVNPAPNPTSYSDEIGASDPYPLKGPTGAVTLNAVVRNIGQADTSTSFYTRFTMDTGPVIQEVQVPALGVGDKQTVSTSSTWTPTSCGYHTLKVDVDSRSTISEGSYYEADNNVTRTLQVFDGTPVTYSGTQTLKYLPIAQNIIITGHMTILNGSIVVTEPQESCSRVFIKVKGTGTLTLINSTITARDNDNWPVVVYVYENGVFEASQNSKILLSTSQGDGVLEVGGNGVLDIADSIVRADVSAHGLRATLNRVTFQGKRLHVNTQNIARIWDPVFQGTNYIALRSDDGIPGTVDVDLRNATLDSVLSNQLVFGGHQYAQITQVITTKTSRWWEGTITQKAKVTRYWWLTVQGVDGTGAVLRSEASLNLTLKRLNIVTLAYDMAPAPVRGDNIFGLPAGTPASWPVPAPDGQILYQAPSEDRYATVGAQWMNATYYATGGAVINGTPYNPDEDIIGLVNSSTTFRLKFSKLTPDLSIDSITFSGHNGDLALQPLNRPMTVTAIVRNTGEISVLEAWVYFWFIDVDANPQDGLMDNQNFTFAPFFIGRNKSLIPALGTATVSVEWDSPTGSLETTYPISAVVDAPQALTTDWGLIKETNERNNIAKRQLGLYTWPDLHLEAGQISMPQPIFGNPVTITVTVRNYGTADAFDARVELRVDTDPNPVDASVTFMVARGGVATTELEWTPLATGPHTLNFTAFTANSEERNTDYHLADNTAILLQDVLSPPDLAVNRSDYLPPATCPDCWYNMTQGGTWILPVKVYNEGQTMASMFTLGIFNRSKPTGFPDSGQLIVQVTNLNLSAGSDMTVQVTIRTTSLISAIGFYNLTIYADSVNGINELDENDNTVNVTLRVRAPEGRLIINLPTEGKEFKPGDTISVIGQALTIAAIEPMPDLDVTVSLLDLNNNVVTSATSRTNTLGGFQVGIPVPIGQADGTYKLMAASAQTDVTSYTISIAIKTPRSILDTQIFGIALWLWLLIIIIAVVVIVAIVAYTRIVGLGKMVECGECGAFIPEDSTKCPKCGVEFEKDMAKCSNCQAWIPLDVKQCPECHVEFATGEVEMADYEQKMKTQYETVKTKFREQAEEEIGRRLTDREFEDWWRRQPSFLTFEDWLREEEEMRKMGSKACPTCSTLNSVTATVCHKCGTLLKKEERRFRQPPREKKEETKPAKTEGAEEGAEPKPTEPIPKKVVVKKPVTPTLIQKKVVLKKPPEEGGESEGGGSGDEGI